jgi:GntR family transcriptional regulator/MocR family aminotransferase
MGIIEGQVDLHLDLGGPPSVGKRAALETALRDAVRDGRLAPGARLPPTRALCEQLGVSRGVVVEVYAQLAAEGYLRTRRGGGTTVAELPSPQIPGPPPSAAAVPIRYDLNPFTPALAEFPRAAWSTAVTRALRQMPDAHLGLPDPQGDPKLREVLAAYLGRVRGVRAEPEQIVITSGTRHGIGLVWAALAARGARRVAIERPGWHGVRETVLDAALRPIPLPVDADGLVIDPLSGLAAVDAVAVAPAHQYPTGAVLSPARRQQLTAWARGGDRLIVEDDYDAEYRYDRQPIGCLQGLAPDHVVYAGSTSKTLSPALRVGWLVLPRALVAAVSERIRIRGTTGSPILQFALAQLIERGDLDRHLRRQRRRYARRRSALLDALSGRLPALTVSGASAGLFAVLELTPGLDERAVADAAAARGIALERRRGQTPALVLGYAGLPPSAAALAVRELAVAIEAVQRQPTPSRSTTNTSVSSGPITPPAPRLP